MSSRLNQYIHFAPFDNVKSDVSNSESSYANTYRSIAIFKRNPISFLGNFLSFNGLSFELNRTEKGLRLKIKIKLHR